MKIIEFSEKLSEIIQMMKLKASEKFKEKHPTHRGLPVGNQVDGLPTELRDSDKTAFLRVRVNQFFLQSIIDSQF